MAKQEITLQNFVRGQLSGDMFGRYETNANLNGLRICRNFIPITQGPAKYRTGLLFEFPTRLNQIANLELFEFNDEQAYQIEFTNGKMRFHRNEQIITETPISISTISQADPAAFTTTAAHLFTTGDQILIADVEGMFEVNGRTALITVTGASTFTVTDLDGINIDSTSFGAYTTGGTVAKIFEIDSPYLESKDLFKVSVTQNANTMYLDHGKYEPRILTRTDHNAWTLALYSRVNDPFVDEQTITGITQANPGVVTAVAHTHEDGDEVYIETVTGMTEVNSLVFVVTNKTANTYELFDTDGNAVDTTGFTAYSASGYSSATSLLPATNTIHESRLFHAGIVSTPARIVGSRAPDDEGLERFDDFTKGTDADHAIFATIDNAEVNKILWITGTDKLLIVGTFGAGVRFSGTDLDKAIAPSSAQARPIDKIGVADVAPVNRVSSVFYVQRGGLTVKSWQYSALVEGYEPIDRNLLSSDITLSGIKTMTWQTGRPDILWAIKFNGKALGLTVEDNEQVSAWHVHTTGGTQGDKFLDVSTMPRPSGFEQVWFVVERIVDDANGSPVTHREICFLADEPTFPQFVDYFTGKNNFDADRSRFLLDMSESQKAYKHVDSCLTFDGTTRGLEAVAAVTPGATTGLSVTFTSDAAVFRSTDVGKEIRKKAIDGAGTGRAVITVVTNSQTVTCNILEKADFDSTSAIAAGDWYLTTNQVINLHHLEGRTVTIVTDGAEHPSRVISGGTHTVLDSQASVIHYGLGFEGLLQPMNLELGGSSGPAQGKLMNVNRVDIRFKDTLGAEIGTDLYNLEEVPFTNMPLTVGAPDPLFNGFKEVPMPDDWSKEKVVFIRKNNPAPCQVQMLAIHGETDND